MTWYSVRIVLAALLLAALVAPSPLRATEPEAETIAIDASRVTGTIRRLNDLDNGPLCQHGMVDLTPYYEELGVRNVRLHDASWSYDNVLDIQYVFPDWNADPDRSESYNFAQSDFYIRSITAPGINIIFRLGYSAEGKGAVRHNAPPPSYDRWVSVVEHIVRHYNQGWASGMHAQIRYWEVWNEPDGAEFWSGTPEQYYRLYEVTALALKKLDSSLVVGGPALAGRMNFLEGFLAYAQKQKLPLDFVSWHIYTRNPDDVAARGLKVRTLMAQYGYPKAQSILDEWNYGPPDWRPLFVDADATRSYFDSTRSAVGAAFDEAVLIGLQDAKVDIATFYTGTTAMWGLFTSSGSPQKPYYAFLAFSRLLESPRRLAVTGRSGSPARVLAGVSQNGHTVRILISNPSSVGQRLSLVLSGLPWKVGTEYETQIVSDRFNFEEAGVPQDLVAPAIAEDVAAHSVVLLTLRQKSAEQLSHPSEK